MNAKMEHPVGFWKRDCGTKAFPLSHGPVWTNNRECVDLSERLLELIESAKKTLWIASPFIDDHRIIDALIRAKSRRVRIKVITDIRNMEMAVEKKASLAAEKSAS